MSKTKRIKACFYIATHDKPARVRGYVYSVNTANGILRFGINRGNTGKYPWCITELTSGYGVPVKCETLTAAEKKLTDVSLLSRVERALARNELQAAVRNMDEWRATLRMRGLYLAK